MISKTVMEQAPVEEMFRHRTDQRIINEDFCSMLVYPCQHRRDTEYLTTCLVSNRLNYLDQTSIQLQTQIQKTRSWIL